MCPRIFAEPLTDGLRIIGAHYQKNIRGAIQGTTKNDHSFRYQSVHEVRMLLPFFLIFQAYTRQPGGPSRSNDGK